MHTVCQRLTTLQKISASPLFVSSCHDDHYSPVIVIIIIASVGIAIIIKASKMHVAPRILSMAVLLLPTGGQQVVYS